MLPLKLSVLFICFATLFLHNSISIFSKYYRIHNLSKLSHRSSSICSACF